jgi:hypothetical protein
MRAVSRAEFSNDAKTPMKQGFSTRHARELRHASRAQSRAAHDRDRIGHEALIMIDPGRNFFWDKPLARRFRASARSRIARIADR